MSIFICLLFMNVYFLKVYHVQCLHFVMSYFTIHIIAQTYHFVKKNLQFNFP
nr:MAG TPA: hypothetical protein [Siphoviridae sp. ctngg6]